MHTAPHDHDVKDQYSVTGGAAVDETVACFRCAEQPGSQYRAEITYPTGRLAERSATMRDALLGGGSPWLCAGCAGVLDTYGQVLGWRLRPASRDRLTAPAGGRRPRTARRVA